MSEGLKVSFKEDHSPNENFFSWLKSNTALFLGQLATIASLILFLATFGYYVLGFHAGKSETSVEEYLDITMQSVFILNMVFCFLFILFTTYISEENKVGIHHARIFKKLAFGMDHENEIKKCETKTEDNVCTSDKKQPHLHETEYLKETYNIPFFKSASKKYKHLSLREIWALYFQRKFKLNFLTYWCYLFGYYSIMAIISDSTTFDDQSKLKITVFINSFLFVIPYWMYAVITKAKIKLRSNDESKLENDKNGRDYNKCTLKWIYPASIWFILFVCIYPSLLCYFDSDANFHIRDLINKSANAISSLINVISFGLLISRLDSKLIGLPSWLTLILFLYASIQPLDIFLDLGSLESKTFSTINYMMVLVIKVYFFFIVTYLLQTGRLFSYLQTSGILSSKLDEFRKVKSTDGLNCEIHLSFKSWINSNKKSVSIFLILSVFTFLGIIAMAIYLIKGDLQPKGIKCYLQVINFILCIILMIYSLKYFQLIYRNSSSVKKPIDLFAGDDSNLRKSIFEHKNNSPKYELPDTDPQKYLSKFFLWLSWFFGSTAAFFLVAFVGKHLNFSYEPVNNYKETLIQAAEIALNSLGSLFLFFCFIQLYLPSIKNEENKGRHMQNYGVIVLCIFIVVGGISLANLKGYKTLASNQLAIDNNSPIENDSIYITQLKSSVSFNDYKINEITQEIKNDEKNSTKVNINSILHFRNADTSKHNGLNVKDSHAFSLKINNQALLQNEISCLENNYIPLATKPIKISTPSTKFNNDSIKFEALKFAISIKPFFKDTTIHLPYHMRFITSGNDQIVMDKIKLTLGKDVVEIDTLNFALLISKTEIMVTDTILTLEKDNINLEIREEYLKSNQTLEVPPYIMIQTSQSNSWLINILRAISGIINALVLCLLISRLDSKFFGLDNYVIAPLFLYAGIQVFFSIFSFEDKNLQTLIPFVLILAFFLKYFLFIALQYLLQTRRFHTYFEQFKDLDWRADAVFANQFEIVTYKIHDANQYSFYVNHDTHKVLNLDFRFNTFTDCLEYINKLRISIEQSPDTLIKTDHVLEKLNGIHRLFIEFDSLTIFSKDFTNEHDLEEFDHEVREQLPYCKIGIGI